MKIHTSKFSERRPTGCDGPEQTFNVERFEIEESDVNKVRSNYGGFCYTDYRFTPSDVGRLIEVVAQGPYYTCWYFWRPI